jgi:sugar (pentulose or hexulose) kinase
VFNPGEIASTAGTSGVVYGVLGDVNYDPKSRVNTFAHVNYTQELDRLGVLLCINGTGILNAWVHRNVTPDVSYADMNDLAAQGKSVIMISSEMPEILGMCDRVYVMNEGRIVAEMQIEDASQEKIMAAILNSEKKEKGEHTQ